MYMVREGDKKGKEAMGGGGSEEGGIESVRAPEEPLPMVRPIFHCPIIFASGSRVPLLPDVVERRLVAELGPALPEARRDADGRCCTAVAMVGVGEGWWVKGV